MPKLPRGMFRRGRSFYTRLFGGGRDRWLSLGKDYEEACTRLLRIRNGEEPLGRTTVAEACERWLQGYVRTARNADGQKLVETRLRRYLVPFMGWKRVTSVTGDDMRAYRLWLENQGIGPQTVGHVLSDSRCLLGWCEDSGMISGSPFPRRVMPRIQERPPDRLTDVEVEALVALHDPHGFVIRFALGTGLRWGELCRAQAGHVERGMLVVSQTKSGRVRRVPLSPSLLAEVRGRVGRLVPFKESNPWAFSLAARRMSGVPRFHPHQLRHTFACRWLERGGSLPALQQILGHASIATTQRYARLSDEVVREQAIRALATETVAEVVAEEAGA